MEQLIITDQEFKGLIAKLCRDITNSEWKPNYVVGLTRGGLQPAVMISHYFNIPCETLKVSLRDGGECESNLWMAEHAFGYVPEDERKDPAAQHDLSRRKNILVVDDINDSGATLEWIRKDWPSGCLPNHSAWSDVWNHNVRFAVVVNNEASSFKDIDYSAKVVNKLENPCWVVFPWEAWWE
jgi:xanthine phosphoribosyltransferase